MNEHLITTSEAAQLAKITQRKMQRLIKDGKISAQKTESGNWQIDKAEFYRVFPETFNTSLATNETEEGATGIVPSSKLLINEKDERIRELKDQIGRLEQQLDKAHEDKDSIIDSLKNTQRLIEHDKEIFEQEKSALKNQLKKKRFLFF